MKIESIQPAGWPRPRGYSNGMSVEGAGRLLFVAGQIAWDERQQLVGPGDLVTQFAQALRNVVSVVEAGGARPGQIVSMTIYVKDKQAYLTRTAEIGDVWREVLGRHYPALALVQVADLLEPGALVEIQAVAAAG